MHSTKEALRVFLRKGGKQFICKFNPLTQEAPHRLLHKLTRNGLLSQIAKAASVPKDEQNRSITGQSSNAPLQNKLLENQVPVPDYLEPDPEDGLPGYSRDSPTEGIFSGLEQDFPCVRDALSAGPEPDYDYIVSGFESFHYKNPFALKHNNGIIPELKVAYETWGELNERRDNAILLFGGLSASSHAKSHPENERKGWWERFVGPGSALDTDKYFVICANHIGGCYGSSGPSTINPLTKKPYGTTFPLISISDMVRAQFLLLDHMGIEKLHAAVGSSLGGMCSIMAGVIYPERIKRLVSISACSYSHPTSIAMRYLQRKAIMVDPKWQMGHYYGTGDYPKTGMKLAREIATITYRSGPEWEQRFGRRHTDNDPSLCPYYDIENYINHQGETGSSKLDPNTLIYISKAMDMFDVGDGYKSRAQALSRVHNPAMVIGVKSDILFPVVQQRELAEQLKLSGNKAVTYYELDSLYGHDTFLLDLNGVGTGVKGFVETQMSENGKGTDFSGK